MYGMFRTRSGYRDYSLKFYPELRQIRGNLRINLLRLRKYFLSDTYKRRKVSNLEKMIINYCPSFKRSTFDIYRELKNHEEDYTRAFRITSSAGVGMAYHENLFTNGDELYVFMPSNYPYKELNTITECIRELSTLEPLKILYTDKLHLDYEVRQHLNDLQESYTVLQVDTVQLFMGYYYWCKVRLAYGKSTEPYKYIWNYVVPNTIYRQIDHVVLNRIDFYIHNPDVKSLPKPKVEYPMYLVETITPKIDKCIKDYIKFFTDRGLLYKLYINSMPLPMLRKGTDYKHPMDIFSLEGIPNIRQYRWVQYATRSKLLLMLIKLGGDKGFKYNKNELNMFKYELRNFERNEAPFPIGMKEENKQIITDMVNELKIEIYGGNFI